MAAKERYEGAFVEPPQPGYHVISKLASSGRGGVDIVKVPTLEIRDDDLYCEFELLEPSLNDMDVENLVASVLLKDFADDYYKDKVSHVVLVNRKTGARRRMPYRRA